MKKILYFVLLCFVGVSLSAQENFVWTDPIVAGADVYGHGWKDMRNTYCRLPARAKAVVSRDVWNNSRSSSGLSLVFRSNAPKILVRYQVTGRHAMFHMPATGVSGVDLYVKDTKDDMHFVAPRFAPSFNDTISYIFPEIVEPLSRESGTVLTFRLSLPLYNGVKWLEIGVPDGCLLDFVPVPDRKPIVIYGSSITQGGCCSRPSMAWPSIVASNLDCEVVNLGFSGSGKGEKEVFDLISEIDASVLVIDCLPNMGLSLPIKERILYGVRHYRETHDCPILLAEYSVCGQEGAVNLKSEIDTDEKNAILHEVYLELCKEGFRNLYYITADEWGAGMDGYVEGVHPNDFGMMNLATGMTRKLAKILKKR